MKWCSVFSIHTLVLFLDRLSSAVLEQDFHLFPCPILRSQL